MLDPQDPSSLLHPDFAGPDDDTIQRSPGVESQLALARAQERLLGEGLPPSAPVMVGRYRITRRLGAGAMGLVYAGKDEQLDREVAIKLLQSQLAGSEASRQRLMREAQAMARLSHPNVAHVYEVGEHEQQLFIAMELVRGETLRRWQRARARSVPEILAMHLQAARGLAAAHAVGLVHRDYKPDNVMISADPRGAQARVMDFGLARARDEGLPSGEHAAVSESSAEALPRSPLLHDATQTGAVMGTPAYMAPEQMIGHRVDARADQFAFCVALYEALHGERPFSGSTITEIMWSVCRADLRKHPRGKIPRAVEAALRRGLAYAPAERFPDMDALVAALEPWAGSVPRTRAVVRAGAAALVLAGGAGLAWMLARPEPPSLEAASVDPWAAIVDASLLPTPLEQPLPDDPAHVTIHRLRNGLTIYLAPRPGVPSVDTVWVVRADGTDAAPDQAGAALLLANVLGDSAELGTSDVAAEAPILAREHAALEALGPGLDEATRTAKLAEAIDARVERRRYEIPSEAIWLGGELGFGTEMQEFPPGTSIAQTVPRHRLAAWARMMSERLRRPAFRSFLSWVSWGVETHREFAQDAARVELDRRLGAATGWWIDDVTIARALLEIPYTPMVRFWRDYYHPNNVALVLVGDVSATEVLPIFEEAFGDWEPAPLPAARLPGPLSPGGARTRVVDDGPAQVTLAWPRKVGDPSSRSVVLLEGLLRRSTLAVRWLEADGRARWVATEGEPYSFEITVAPAGTHSLEEAEAAVRDLLGVLARGELDPAELRAAQAQAQLQSLSWTSSAYGLSTAIAQSFAQRVDWPEHLAALRGDPLEQGAIMAAAREVLDAGGLVVQREPGPAAIVALPSVSLPDRASLGPPAKGPSALGARLLDAPVSRLEPQFLVAGRDLAMQAWGNGRVIAVDEDVPIHRMRFIVPFGVADDPWACDAWRARVSGLARIGEPLGVEMTALCGPRSTSIDVVSVAARIDEVWPHVLRLAEAELADADAERQLVAARTGRQHLRTHEIARREAFAVLALFGEEGIDANMPDDATLARAQAADLRGALARSLAFAPDVLLAGPDARGLIARLPAPSHGAARVPELPRTRPLAATTVFVMDEPSRSRLEVRAGIVVSARDPATMVATDVLRLTPDGELDVAVHEPVTRFAMPFLDTVEGRQIVASQGADCAPQDLGAVLDMLLALQRHPPTSADFARARGFVEIDLRKRRRAGLEAALHAWSWAALGRTTDPSIEEWMGLGALDDAALAAFHAKLAAQPVVLTVLGDLDRVDREVLARHGEIVEIRPEQLRDPEVADRMRFGFEPGPP